MIDPYKVLGVSRDASMDEIKKAYRSLSRKYHPDANINNPLKDEAEAKFKEVLQAYQQIVDERERGQSSEGSYGNAGSYGGFDGFGGFGSYSQGAQSSSGNSETDMHLHAAGRYLQAGRYQEALHVLEGIKERTALWYFYSASANAALGNNITAKEYARKAVEMEPDNYQFKLLLSNLENGGNWYRQTQSMYGYPTTINIDCCTKLCIANLACNLCLNSGMCCGTTTGMYM